jgi:hypothetical protein
MWVSNKKILDLVWQIYPYLFFFLLLLHCLISSSTLPSQEIPDDQGCRSDGDQSFELPALACPQWDPHTPRLRDVVRTSTFSFFVTSVSQSIVAPSFTKRVHVPHRLCTETTTDRGSNSRAPCAAKAIVVDGPALRRRRTAPAQPRSQLHGLLPQPWH